MRSVRLVIFPTLSLLSLVACLMHITVRRDRVVAKVGAFVVTACLYSQSHSVAPHVRIDEVTGWLDNVSYLVSPLSCRMSRAQNFET